MNTGTPLEQWWPLRQVFVDIHGRSGETQPVLVAPTTLTAAQVWGNCTTMQCMHSNYLEGS